MAKKLLQDIVEKKRQPPRKVEHYDISSKKLDDEVRFVKRDGENFSRHGLWFVALASVLFLLFSFSFLFAGAKITIGPRIEEINLNQSFSALKDGAMVADLPFETVVISGEENKNVEGGEEKSVSLNAEGLVVVYNKFSSASQRLDINTRLEGSNGKIYKTQKAVIVPGMSGSIPGSVEVWVYGAEAGEAYNSSPLDFTVLGFKGTSKYSKFYAISNINDEKTKGEIGGGFIGTMRQISDSEKAKLSDELKASLKIKLFNKAIDQTPLGFVLFKNATFLNIDEEDFSSTSGEDIIPVKVKGTLYGILFEEKALTKKIIEKFFPGEEGNEIYIQNIRNLIFTLENGVDSLSLADAKNINFNLSGTSNIVWKIDEEKLLLDISGKKKKDFNSILAQYPNIISAQLSLHPFWSRSLPDDKEDMKIFITYPE